MLRVALGQMEVIPGRPDLNTKKMKEMIQEAADCKAQVIIFPEMAVPGYFLGDTWEQESFLRDCESYGQEIVAASQNICVIFGNVAVDWQKRNNDGRVRKYNALFTAYKGNLLQGEKDIYPYKIKTLQPNFREFDDERHFFSMQKLALELKKQPAEILGVTTVELDGKAVSLGLMLCEDAWSDDYDLKPIAEMTKTGKVDLLINISCSPFTLGKNNKRQRVFSPQIEAAKVPLIYLNQVGTQNIGKTVYAMDGQSAVYNRSGEIVYNCSAFAEELRVIGIDLCYRDICYPVIKKAPVFDSREIFSALEYGIKRFMEQIGVAKVVVGVSGGIDSAVTAALFSWILGKDKVLLVNMPSKYNADLTKSLAKELARNLGTYYAEVPIQAAYENTVIQLEELRITDLAGGNDFSLPLQALVKENIQARDRSARILAALSGMFGGVFSCNANKSELTVGYSTLYGDMAGFMAPIGDLWKHQVYDLARYLNQEVYGREVIPQGIIDLVPSAELSAAQDITVGQGDPFYYPYHDFLFRAFVERWQRATPEDILRWYAEGRLEKEIGCEQGAVAKIFPDEQSFIDDLERWWQMFAGIALAKRIQAPPVFAVSRRAYGYDYREAQNSVYYSRSYLQLKEKLLQGF